MSNIRIPRDSKWAKSCVTAYKADLPEQGISYREVRVKPESRRITTDRHREIREVYLKHRSIRKAGRELGMSPSRVHQIIRDHFPDDMQPWPGRKDGAA